ncbi:hypothetical protein [Lewinella sp. IMCC34191]|uniref:hypothetical protein n=1 Tax=Lewinella sp. IMCC34191 TaxID=2259172 RepID=UPI0013005E08|nr:hypothetical protein [Lewinella sp. IMCC34191]
MSKSLLSLFSLLLLLFSACKDKGEDDFLTESDIIGTWQITEFDNAYQLSGTFAGEPVDDQGESRISNSDLQMIFLDNGRWQSTGGFTLTVTTPEEQQISDRTGMGTGTWSFSQDTLFVSGLQHYNETGYFKDRQPLVLNGFKRDISLDLGTTVDVTESDENYGIRIRTVSRYDISMER